jgi:hypothetical protein
MVRGQRRLYQRVGHRRIGNQRAAEASGGIAASIIISGGTLEVMSSGGLDYIEPFLSPAHSPPGNICDVSGTYASTLAATRVTSEVKLAIAPDQVSASLWAKLAPEVS